MTGALAKWEAALDTFDGIKHNFRAPGQIEKALNSIALDERVLLFRGCDSDIVERLSPYDQAEGECELGRVHFCSRVMVVGNILPACTFLQHTLSCHHQAQLSTELCTTLT